MLRFRSFHDPDSATDLSQWLTERGIPARVQESSGVTNPYMAESILTKSYEVHLPPADFDRATGALAGYYAAALHRVPPDYYLHTFTDAELMDILRKPDEWGELDYELAQALLARRGHAISPTEAAHLKTSRLMELAEPQGLGRGPAFSDWMWMLFFGSVLMLPPIGAMLGWHIAHAQKVLPDGSQVTAYTERAQQKGWWMFRIGLAITALLLALALMPGYRFAELFGF